MAERMTQMFGNVIVGILNQFVPVTVGSKRPPGLSPVAPVVKTVLIHPVRRELLLRKLGFALALRAAGASGHQAHASDNYDQRNNPRSHPIRINQAGLCCIHAPHQTLFGPGSQKFQ